MSRPARSSVRNVALFGRPIAGPVIASISSIVYSPAATSAEDARDSREREVVADEVRRVLRDHHALAEVVIGEPR